MTLISINKGRKCQLSVIFVHIIEDKCKLSVSEGCDSLCDKLENSSEVLGFFKKSYHMKLLIILPGNSHTFFNVVLIHNYIHRFPN